MAESFEPFVTADVVANFLSIPRRMVAVLARRGEIPAHPLTGRLRKTWRFKISEVAAALNTK